MKRAGILVSCSCMMVLLWIPITYIYQVVLYDATSLTNKQEILEYYGDHKNYIALDHGTKSIGYFLMAMFPMMIAYKLKSSSNGKTEIQLFSLVGSMSFVINAMSLMIQAFTAKQLIELYNTQSSDKEVYLNFFDIFILNGVFSYSLYFFSYVLYFIWVIGIYRYLIQFNKYIAKTLMASSVFSLLSAVSIFLKHLLNINVIDISSLTDVFILLALLIISLYFASHKNKMV